MSAVVVVTAHRHHIRSTTVTYYEADVTVVERRVCHRRCSSSRCCRHIIVPYYEVDVTVVKRRVCHRCCSYYCRRIIVSYYEADVTVISFTLSAYPTARQALVEKGLVSRFQ